MRSAKFRESHYLDDSAMTMKELEAGSAFESASFTDLLLDGATVREKEFEACAFAGCSLREARLNECRFIDCTFSNCDLTASSVTDTAFRGVTFTSSKLVGIGWDRAECSLGFGVRFEDCILDLGSFSGMRLSDVEFVNCRAHEMSFDSATFKGVTIRDTDLSRSDFSRADLRDADLSGALLAVDLSSCRIGNTTLSLDSALSTLAAMGITVDLP